MVRKVREEDRRVILAGVGIEFMVRKIAGGAGLTEIYDQKILYNPKKPPSFSLRRRGPM